MDKFNPGDKVTLKKKNLQQSFLGNMTVKKVVAPGEAIGNEETNAGDENIIIAIADDDEMQKTTWLFRESQLEKVPELPTQENLNDLSDQYHLACSIYRKQLLLFIKGMIGKWCANHLSLCIKTDDIMSEMYYDVQLYKFATSCADGAAENIRLEEFKLEKKDNGNIELEISGTSIDGDCAYTFLENELSVEDLEEIWNYFGFIDENLSDGHFVLGDDSEIQEAEYRYLGSYSDPKDLEKFDGKNDEEILTDISMGEGNFNPGNDSDEYSIFDLETQEHEGEELKAFGRFVVVRRSFPKKMIQIFELKD